MGACSMIAQAMAHVLLLLHLSRHGLRQLNMFDRFDRRAALLAFLCHQFKYIRYRLITLVEQMIPSLHMGGVLFVASQCHQVHQMHLLKLLEEFAITQYVARDYTFDELISYINDSEE